MKHSGDLSRYVRLNWCGVFRSEFLSARPQVISRYGVGVRMLTRSIPWRLPRWILPETTYLSSDEFGGARLGVQRGPRAIQANEKPRQRRKRSVTRRSVKPSTRHCCLVSPVRLRNGATATAMLGSRQGQRGGDSPDSPDC